MAVSREEAWELLCEWTDTAPLRKHARAVELVMRKAAHRYGAGAADEDVWGLAGMLHDADYEKWPEEHPRKIVAWLNEKGPEEQVIAHAISAHYTKWGASYDTAMDKALLACDELTGFVMACCWVRPDGIASLDLAGVKRKLKDKRFAAKVERSEVEAGAAMLGVELDAHVAFVLEALKENAAELGLSARVREDIPATG